ncbi:MAG: hypothetical protein KDA44_23055, partial [Planctomycetales bacterium]|nr:hypothetical protein [Planctomycetales bacterium]
MDVTGAAEFRRQVGQLLRVADLLTMEAEKAPCWQGNVASGGREPSVHGPDVRRRNRGLTPPA